MFNAKKSNAFLTANITAIAANGAAFNELVQVTLIAGLVHAEACGDSGPLLRLVQAMPTSVRRELAIKFISRYSPVVVLPLANKGVGKHGSIAKDAPNYVPFNLDGARAAHWTDKAKKADADALDILAADTAIMTLAKRLENASATANDNDRKVIMGRVTALRAMAKTVEAKAA